MGMRSEEALNGRAACGTSDRSSRPSTRAIKKFLNVEIETVPRVMQFAGFAGANIAAVGQEESRLRRVSQIGFEHFAEYLVAEFRIAQVIHHFDALVDIALHPVRAAQIDFRLSGVSENKDTAVLEESSDHAADADAAADSRANRGVTQAPRTTSFDLNSGLRSLV